MKTDRADWRGQVLAADRYHVEALLGQGGMGDVYKARDRRLDTDVVIKVPRRELLFDAEFARRFTHEVRALVRLAHPHVVHVLDVGEHDGLPYCVLQYLDGGSLDDARRSRGAPRPVPPGELAGWLDDVAAALDFVHTNGYVHRDVKPANILFDGHRNVYLSDFGIAKALAGKSDRLRTGPLTGTGMVLGTPQYMAPELIMGQPYGGAVDQYALAVLVFELLAGRLPFDGPNAAALFVEHTTRPPPLLHERIPGLPPALSAALTRGMAKGADQRYPSCRDLAAAVLAAAEVENRAPAPRPPTPSKPALSAPSPQRVTCRRCSTTFTVPVAALRKRLRCSTCGAVVPPPVSSTAPTAETTRTPQAKVETTTNPRVEWEAPALEEPPPPPPVGRIVLAISLVLLVGAVLVWRLWPTDPPPPTQNLAAARATGLAEPKPEAPQKATTPESVPVAAGAAGAPADVRLRVAEVVGMDAGSDTDLTVRVERHGYAGTIQLQSVGLPPGVQCASVVIPAGAETGVLRLQAATEADGAEREFQVVGRLAEGVEKRTAVRLVLRTAFRPFEPPQGRFRIAMPGTPNLEKVSVPAAGPQAEINNYRLERAGLSYTVAYGDASWAEAQGSARALEAAAALFVHHLGADLRDDRKVSVAGHPGRDLFLVRPGGKVCYRCRVYVVQNRLYAMTVSGTREDVEGPGAQKFLDSFELLNPAPAPAPRRRTTVRLTVTPKGDLERGKPQDVMIVIDRQGVTGPLTLRVAPPVGVTAVIFIPAGGTARGGVAEVTLREEHSLAQVRLACTVNAGEGAQECRVSVLRGSEPQADEVVRLVVRKSLTEALDQRVTLRGETLKEILEELSRKYDLPYWIDTRAADADAIRKLLSTPVRMTPGGKTRAAEVLNEVLGQAGSDYWPNTSQRRIEIRLRQGSGPGR